MVGPSGTPARLLLIVHSIRTLGTLSTASGRWTRHRPNALCMAHIHRDAVGGVRAADELVESRIVRLELVGRLDLDVALEAFAVGREEPPLNAFGPVLI